jgi:hypothetical protein
MYLPILFEHFLCFSLNDTTVHFNLGPKKNGSAKGDGEKRNKYTMEAKLGMVNYADVCQPVIARSEAFNVFACSYTEVMAPNPTRDMDICVYSLFVTSCVGSGLAKG